MQAPYTSAGPFASPDALSAAAHFVDREWGSYGYSLSIAASASRVTIFEVAHFDGSRFNVAADKWGNTRKLSDDLDTARLEVAAMVEIANAS